MRLVYTVLIVGALAISGLLVFFLLPAHIQVRGVEPALPSADSLRALMSVANTPVSVRYITTSTQQLSPNALSHNSVVIRWANGDVVLLDVGMDERGAVEFGDLMLAMRDGSEPVVLGTVSGLMRDDISQVKAVGFTHLHIDHTQGLIDFCRARGSGARVIQSEDQHSLHNFNTTEGANIVEQSCLQSTVVAGEGMILFEEFPGLAMIPIGGHTPGSTLFAVVDGDRLLLFSGDTTNNKAHILHDVAKSFVYSYLLVPENTRRTSELRSWLARLDRNADMEVVVAHDLENFARVLKPYR